MNYNEIPKSPFKLLGSWLGLFTILIFITPFIISSIKVSSNSCIGSQHCNYNEECGDPEVMWDINDGWGYIEARPGICKGEVFCSGGQLCKPLKCNNNKYVHIRRADKLAPNDQVTWHMCIDDLKDFNSTYYLYCIKNGHDCLVYDNNENIIPQYTTGNTGLVNKTTLKKPRDFFLPFALTIALSLLGFVIGWIIHVMIKIKIIKK